MFHENNLTRQNSFVSPTTLKLDKGKILYWTLNFIARTMGFLWRFSKSRDVNLSIWLDKAKGDGQWSFVRFRHGMDGHKPLIPWDLPMAQRDVYINIYIHNILYILFIYLHYLYNILYWFYLLYIYIYIHNILFVYNRYNVYNVYSILYYITLYYIILYHMDIVG